MTGWARTLPLHDLSAEGGAGEGEGPDLEVCLPAQSEVGEGLADGRSHLEALAAEASANKDAVAACSRQQA